MGTSDWGMRSQRARSRPDLPGQHQVQHHQLVMPVGPGAAGFFAVPHGGNANLLLLQKPCEQVADFTVVIDDEDMRLRFHGL